MTILIIRAYVALAHIIEDRDFSFFVEAFHEPIFGRPVAQWPRTPVPAYRKDYRAHAESESAGDASDALFLAWGFTKWGGMGELRQQWLVLAQVVAIIPLILSRQRRVHELLVPVVLLLFCIHHLNEPLFA